MLFAYRISNEQMDLSAAPTYAAAAAAAAQQQQQQQQQQQPNSGIGCSIKPQDLPVPTVQICG